MRNISFNLTKDQFLNRNKFVTRRLGWKHLKPGDVLMGVEKCQGLKKGEKMIRLGLIRVVTVRRERLRAMTDRYGYGLEETNLEGFFYYQILWDPDAFVKFFCATHRGCTPETEVTRIEFEYL